MVTQRPIHLPPRIEGVLRPCPFCGGQATLEPDPWLGESFRIACGNRACRIAPRTEYLLASFADELWAAWNERPAPPPGPPSFRHRIPCGTLATRVHTGFLASLAASRTALEDWEVRQRLALGCDAGAEGAR